jgi:ribosomal protein S18 acetylase RimI-like enzyme
MSDRSVTAATDAERIAAATRWIEEVTSTRLVDSPLGTALYNDDFRVRYDSNFLRVEGSTGTTDAEEVAAACDALFEGYAHREVIVEDARRGAAMAPGFGELGWRVDRLVTMARRGEPDAPTVTDLVTELDVGEIVGFTRAVHLRNFPADTHGVADTLAAFSAVLHERAGARFFGVRVDGEVASACELYVHEGVAQIEDVNTLEPFRGRGLARQVVSFAAQEALARGADLVWLIADDNDWPKELYAKLGFRPVDTFWQFTLADD